MELIRLRFDKYVAAGNDFILLNGLANSYENHNELAKSICNRHFGIGADGILICEESEVADIKMLYFNSDGSQGEMCGNGIRSFTKYIYDNGIVGRKSISVETLSGVKYIDIVEMDEFGKVEKIKVDMGYPIFRGEEIPININKEFILEEDIKINDKNYKFSALTVGVPHVVIFVEDIGTIDINGLGKAIENHSLFPRKTNVNFIELVNKDNINIYTWERGAGRTLGCGTGSCASVVIGNRLQRLSKKVNVKTEGGYLTVELKEDSKILMTGDAIHIAKGEYKLK